MTSGDVVVVGAGLAGLACARELQGHDLDGLPVGGVRGKAAFGVYAGLCATVSAATLKKRKDVTSWEAWRQAGIPPALVDGVLRPFFSGVVLEQEMTTSRRFTDQMMRMFARGRSTVPAGGMQELPRQLADQLPTGSVRTDAPVASVHGDRVVLEDGSTVSAAAVVSGRRAARTVVRDLLGTSR